MQPSASLVMFFNIDYKCFVYKIHFKLLTDVLRESVFEDIQ